MLALLVRIVYLPLRQQRSRALSGWGTVPKTIRKLATSDPLESSLGSLLGRLCDVDYPENPCVLPSCNISFFASSPTLGVSRRLIIKAVNCRIRLVPLPTRVMSSLHQNARFGYRLPTMYNLAFHTKLSNPSRAKIFQARSPYCFRSC
jgi:hypothetical protein